MNISYNLEWLRAISTKKLKDLRKFLSLTNEPIIICGCGRSGTSLLLSIVSASPEVYGLPIETKVLCHQNNISPLVSRFNNKRKLAAYIDQIKPNATRWCEKTPRNVRFIHDLIEAYNGKIKILNIVRDGRDVICSIHPTRNGYWLEHTRWINDVSAALEFEKHTSVYTIKYEDLILDTQSTIEKITTFLKIPFHNNMIEFNKHTNVKKLNSFHGGHVSGIYDSSIGKWRKPEHKDHVSNALKNKRFVELLKHYNYE